MQEFELLVVEVPVDDVLGPLDFSMIENALAGYSDAVIRLRTLVSLAVVMAGLE